MPCHTIQFILYSGVCRTVGFLITVRNLGLVRPANLQDEGALPLQERQSVSVSPAATRAGPAATRASAAQTQADILYLGAEQQPFVRTQPWEWAKLRQVFQELSQVEQKRPTTFNELKTMDGLYDQALRGCKGALLTGDASTYVRPHLRRKRLIGLLQEGVAGGFWDGVSLKDIGSRPTVPWWHCHYIAMGSYMDGSLPSTDAGIELNFFRMGCIL